MDQNQYLVFDIDQSESIFLFLILVEHHLMSYLQCLQGLKVFDNSVENLASGAWQALGSAWKGGTNLVQKYVSLHFNVSFSFPIVISCTRAED